MSNALIPHEVETHLRQAKGHHRKAIQYSKRSEDMEMAAWKLSDKADEHRKAAGVELVAARNGLREAGLIPPGPGRAGSKYPMTWGDVIGSDLSQLSLATVKRYMALVESPEQVVRQREKDREAKAEQRAQAAAWQMENEPPPPSNTAPDPEDPVDREAMERADKIRAARKQCREYLTAKLNELSEPEQMHELADLIINFNR